MRLDTIVLVFMMIPALCSAENYEVSVTRKSSNLYKVDGANVFIQTKYCYEYVYCEKAILKMHGYYGQIIFLGSGGKCDVGAVYGPAEQSPGKYLVNVSRVSDDWYVVLGTEIYIKTMACLSLALGNEAILSISSGGYGRLHIDGHDCMVEGIYAKLEL